MKKSNLKRALFTCGLLAAALPLAAFLAGGAIVSGIGYAADKWGKAHPDYLAQKQFERDAATGPIADRMARQRARHDARGARRTIDSSQGATIYPGGHKPPAPPNRTEFPADPPDRSKHNGTEAFPAQPSQPEILKGPEIKEARPGVFVFPDLTGSFNDWMILERRRGNEKTRAGLEKLRDYFHEVILHGNPEWEHIAGGRDKKTNQEKAEFWIPGPQKDFQRKGETIDGRKGGKFADLTFENQRTGEIIHVQSVDTDKNGKPTERELNNAEIIRKRTGASVYLFAKDAIPQ